MSFISISFPKISASRFRHISHYNEFKLKKQAAILLEEAEVSAKKIHEIICTLKANPNKRLSLENNVEKHFCYDTNRILEEEFQKLLTDELLDVDTDV